MFHFSTKVEDIAKWRGDKQFDKIIKALSNKDAAVRAAAAEALTHMDNSTHYTSQSILDAAGNALLPCLNDSDMRVIIQAASALRHLQNPQALEPLMMTLNSAKDSDIRNALLKAIESMLYVNDREEEEHRFLAVLQRLSHPSKFSSETIEALLYILAEDYIRSDWSQYNHQKEESPMGIALTDFGPKAGMQLIRSAEELRKFPKLAGLANAGKEFGERIAAGKECGSKHTFNGECICTKCGKTKHDFSNQCICKRCGFKEHQWDLKGVYRGYFHRCMRCGAEMHVESGNIMGSAW